MREADLVPVAQWRDENRRVSLALDLASRFRRGSRRRDLRHHAPRQVLSLMSVSFVQLCAPRRQHQSSIASAPMVHAETASAALDGQALPQVQPPASPRVKGMRLYAQALRATLGGEIGCTTSFTSQVESR